MNALGLDFGLHAGSVALKRDRTIALHCQNDAGADMSFYAPDEIDFGPHVGLIRIRPLPATPKHLPRMANPTAERRYGRSDGPALSSDQYPDINDTPRQLEAHASSS